MQMDCRGVGKRVLQEFISYVKETGEKTLIDMVKGNRGKYTVEVVK